MSTETSEVCKKMPLGTTLIVLARGGSHAYGTAVEGSDLDLRGIFAWDLERLLRFMGTNETLTSKPDITLHDLRKFGRLAVQGNPGILELLFTEGSDILFSRPAWEELRAIRHEFLSQNVARTFCGYAVAQLNKCLNGRATGGRGPGRQTMIEKHGYDTKNAMHLVRVLRSGLEILQTGHLQVRRPDAEELLTIRNGAWSQQEVVTYARHMLAKMEQARKTTDLPEVPLPAVEDCVVEIYKTLLE